MIVNYSNEVVNKSKKSIFLAGPTIRRNEITQWRLRALEIFEKLNFDGVVFIPEYTDMYVNGDYLTKQMLWEREALEATTVILFWVPRDEIRLPGFTTNVEFGFWINRQKIIYGRPDDAVHIRYLDWLYEYELNKKPINDLEMLIKEAILMCENGK